MAYHFENKDNASAAGKAGGRGKHDKTKRWEALQEKFSGAYADKVIDYLDTLTDTGDVDDMKLFMNHYKDLLNYFKPKYQSTTMNANINGLDSIVVKGKRPDNVE